MNKNQWFVLSEVYDEQKATSDNLKWLSLLESRLIQNSPQHFLEIALAEIATDCQTSWTALLQRTGSWEPLHEIGNFPGERRIPPPSLLAEACERGQAVICESSQLPFLIIAPLSKAPPSDIVLCMASNEPVDGKVLIPKLSQLTRLLDLSWNCCKQLSLSRHLEQQSLDLLETTRTLHAIRHKAPLLAYISQQAVHLVKADCALVFLWDEPRHLLTIGSVHGHQKDLIHVPNDQGIVGRIVRHRKPLLIHDVSTSPDFNPSIDQTGPHRTQSLIGVPLITSNNTCMGVLKVINDKRTEGFDEKDLLTLQEWSTQATLSLQNIQERETLLRIQQQNTRQAIEDTHLIGNSTDIQELRSTITNIANTDLPVTVLGESGSGKTTACRAIHFNSPRRHHSLLSVHCARASESQVDIELFGSGESSLSDPDVHSRGKIELASGGSIFLDEIGNLGMDTQGKLLQVLTEKQFTNPGIHKPTYTDVRIIAATSEDLTKAVQDNTFRRELYFRISSVTIPIPALRDRAEDILPLAEFFIDRFCHKTQQPIIKLSRKARRRLQEHSWPGNIQELQNVMERLVFLSSETNIESEDLTLLLLQPRANLTQVLVGSDTTHLPLPLTEATERFQQKHIDSAIQYAEGNMTEAAKLLGLHRPNLYRKMKQLGIPDHG